MLDFQRLLVQNTPWMAVSVHVISEPLFLSYKLERTRTRPVGIMSHNLSLFDTKNYEIISWHPFWLTRFSFPNGAIAHHTASETNLHPVLRREYNSLARCLVRCSDAHRPWTREGLAIKIFWHVSGHNGHLVLLSADSFCQYVRNCQTNDACSDNDNGNWFADRSRHCSLVEEINRPQSVDCRIRISNDYVGVVEGESPVNR